jgi:hypothetical protein
MRRLMMLMEAIPTWTYRLDERGKDYFIAQCQSNTDDTVEIVIWMRGGNLGWDIKSHEVVGQIQKTYGGTGLMKPIIAAIHEALGIYLASVQPSHITVQGGDPRGLRQKMYVSWVAWKFPGYTSQAIDSGVAFIRHDQKGRTLKDALQHEFVAEDLHREKM